MHPDLPDCPRGRCHAAPHTARSCSSPLVGAPDDSIRLAGWRSRLGCLTSRAPERRVHATVEARQHLATLLRIGGELFVAGLVQRRREPRGAELLLLRFDLADEGRELAEMSTGHAWPGIALHPADGSG